MTGHSHYVMCAQWHPSRDLIVSCSLDATLRLWDFSQLRRKFSSEGGGRGQRQPLIGNEVELVLVIEGHDKGVNWCCFHPTSNIIASASDDRKVKL